MEITWYGTASLILREGDKAIAFDPFFDMPVGCFTNKDLVSLPKDDFRAVTDIFVTHGHFDHIYYLPELCGLSHFLIHCTQAPRKTLIRRGVSPERIIPAVAGQTDSAPPFTVTAYQSRHCRYTVPTILQTVFGRGFFRHPIHLLRLLQEMLCCPEKGEILLYEVSWAGKRIQILGSLGLDGNTEYPTGADILILPFQGRSDLKTYALDIVRRLKPCRVLLDHYDNTFPPISNDIPTENFIKILCEQERIPCSAMVKGRSIHVETEKTLG